MGLNVNVTKFKSDKIQVQTIEKGKMKSQQAGQKSTLYTTIKLFHWSNARKGSTFGRPQLNQIECDIMSCE